MSRLWTILLLVALAGQAFAHSNPNAVKAGDSPIPRAAIVIGMSNALSGPTAALGTELKQGVEAWFARVNARGGIHGRMLKLVSLDDGYEPGNTVSNTRILLEQEKAFLLFGYVGTPTSQVALPIAQRAGVPFVAPFTGAGFLRTPLLPGVFHVRASYPNETEAMVGFLTSERQAQRIALLIQDDAFGSAGRSGATKALQKRGLEPVAVAKYQRNTTDIEPALAKLREAKPDAIILVGAYAPCAAFIKAAKARNFNPIFMNISFVGTRGLIKALGTEGDGVYITQVMPSPADTSLPLVSDYQRDMLAMGLRDSDDDYGALEGYTDARVLTRILEMAGPQLTRASFNTAAESLKTFDEGGLSLNFGPENHQASYKVFITQIQGGRANPVK